MASDKITEERQCEIARICHTIGLSEPDTVRCGTAGTNETFIVDERYVFKFWTDAPEWFDREVEILQLLSAHVPQGRRLYAYGRSINPPGQRYLVREFIPGIPWRHVSESMSEADKLLTARALGRDVAGFHMAPTATMQHFDFSADHMRGLSQDYANATLALWQRKRPAAVAALEAYLHTSQQVLKDVQPILGNNDIYEDHILVRDQDGRFTYSGFIDFGDADCSEIEYELVKIHLNAFRCRADLTNAFLQGYRELREASLSLAKCKSYGLLHRFGFCDIDALVDWDVIESSPDGLRSEMDRLWTSLEVD